MESPKALAALLMKKHGMGEAPAPRAQSQDSQVSPDELDAAQDVLDAVHGHDAKALVLAFKDLDSVLGPDEAPSAAPSEDEGAAPETEGE